MAEGTHVCGVEGDDEHVHWRESVPCGVMWQRSGTGGVGPPRVEYRTEGGDRRRGVEEGGGDPWLAWARRGWFFWLVWVAEGMRECGRRGGCTGAARVGRGVRRDGAWLSTSEAGGDGRGAEGSAEVVRGESKGRMGGGGGCGTLARHAGFSHDKGWQSRTLGVWAAASGGYDWVAAAFSLVGWLADGLHGLGLVVGGRRSSMLFSAGWGLLGFNRFGALCLGVGFLLLSFAFFLLMWCSVVQTFLSFAGDQLEACALLVRACVLVGVGEVCAGLDGFFDSALRLLLLRLLADVAAVAMGVAEAFRRAAVGATDNMCALAYGINELDRLRWRPNGVEELPVYFRSALWRAAGVARLLRDMALFRVPAGGWLLCLSRAQLRHGSHCGVVTNDGVSDRHVCVWGRSRCCRM